MSVGVELRRARPLLGTFVEITATGPNEQRTALAIERAFAAIAQVHQLMSRHDPASDIGRLNRDGAKVRIKVHHWTFQVLQAAKRFSAESHGAFDVTLGLGGSWRDIVLQDGNCIRFRQPLTLDLGGIAKGFAVDRAVATLRKARATSGIVNAGGDLRVFGPQARFVHIRDPLSPGRAAGGLLLRERAIATSALYFAPALFDGRSGKRLREKVSVTVGATDCMTADALTKVILALGQAGRDLLTRYQAEALLLDGKAPPRWLVQENAHELHQA